MLRAGGPQYYPLRPESVVGGEVYERELLLRLPAHGVEVVVGLPASARHARVPAGWSIDRLRHGPGLHWTLAPLVFVPYALRVIGAGRVDLLRGASLRYAGPSLIAARALTRSRVPIVLHHHHSEPRWAWLEAIIMRGVDAVVTVSEHSRRQLLDAGVPSRRVFVVADGVEGPPSVERWDEAWPEPRGLRLLHLGRLIERKRPEVAVEALAELAVGDGGADRPPASLVFAGDGPLRPQLERRVHDLGLEGRVTFLGSVSDRDKWRLYHSAELLLFPSPLEGFGLVVAEAQSRGVPAICAEGTATAEVIVDGETGLLAAGDPVGFAAAIRRLAEPGERAAFGARAAEHARRFDWDTCAAGVAEVYRSVAAGRSEAP